MTIPNPNDGRESAALVTGTLLAILGDYARKVDRPVLIDRVRMVDDVNGNHLAAIKLDMRSGVELTLIVADTTP